MAFTNLLMVLQCLLLLTIMQVSIAQNLPIDFIVAHNNARAQVGVGRVRWDYVLARYAQDYANSMVNSCNLVHSDGPYGENIAWGSGEFLTGTGAVDMWVSENQDYDYNSNTCAAGKVCGHYTQVVWRDSVRIGCARVTCNNNKGVFITCNYDPPGNYIGRWPYSISF